MDERLEAELRHRGVNRADVVERVLAREHDAVDAELLRSTAAPLASCTVICVEPWISRSGIDVLDQANEPDVLHDHGVDAAVDCTRRGASSASTSSAGLTRMLSVR